MISQYRTKKPAAVQALKVLNYALNKNPKNCKQFIEAGGLKLIFPILMGKGLKEKKKEIAEKNQGKMITFSLWLIGLLLKFRKLPLYYSSVALQC